MTGLPQTKTDKRVVRVFISSTFKDMQEEREELVKHVFPELRKRCRERRVEFVGVDLRWGITDEQKSEGRVLPICLAEIEGCRPYFIGLLGERYGWVPEKIEEELLSDQPWLNDHTGKSVTELEIWHGVLNDSKMAGLAYFYFRDRNKSLAIEETLSKEPAYMPEPETSRERLKDLKEKITASGYPVKTDYPDAKALGAMVLDDLWDAIDKRYPLEEVPTELEQRRLDHEAFAAMRTETYIGREEYFKRLNDHKDSDGPPLVILGESGSGKSALIANWVKKYRQTHPETFIITHYIGSTTDSADYVQMLRRIMEEIKHHLDPDSTHKQEISALSTLTPDENAIPSDPKKIVEAFPLWLARVAAKEKFILIIDALNQLEDRDNAPDLGWLPWSFSVNVRLILSTLPGRSLDALHKRAWPEMTIGLMDPVEQEKYIPKYLARYRKSLEPSQISRIISAPQTANPLYLRTLLEELRVFGVYEELGSKIDHYLQAQTPDALFALVLERLEQDYERERSNLVRDVMSLIWASRRGLAETELLELLGTPDNPMPRAIWSPLYLALEDSLVSRSGLLTFFHDFLRRAVEDRYLSAEENKKKAHLALADYFERKELDNRKVDELPWQLMHADQLKRLHNFLTDISTFLDLFYHSTNDLLIYWISMSHTYDPAESYSYAWSVWNNNQKSWWKKLADSANCVGCLLEIQGHYQAATEFFKRSIDLCLPYCGTTGLTTLQVYRNLGISLYHNQQLVESAKILRDTLQKLTVLLGPRHILTLSAADGLAKCLGDQNSIEEARVLYGWIMNTIDFPAAQLPRESLLLVKNHAIFLGKIGRFSEAEQALQIVVERLRSVGGQNDLLALFADLDLADLRFKQCKYSDVIMQARECLPTLVAIFGRDHVVTQQLVEMAEAARNRSRA